MKVETTSITYKGVHIFHSDLRNILSHVIYPKYLDGFDTLSVMIVCVRGEDHQHDAYIYEGEPFIAIALDYNAVAGLSYEVLTVISKNELVAYLNSLPGLPEREAA